MASTVISTSASATDRHSIERIVGDRICESALTAASSMAVYLSCFRREVDMPSAPGKSRLLKAGFALVLNANRYPLRLKTLCIERLAPDIRAESRHHDDDEN